MANIYESDTFNIESVYLSNPSLDPDYPEQTWFCSVQRLPLHVYPLKTEVYISKNDIPVSSTRDEFLALAPSLVAARLAEYDAQENGVWEPTAELAIANSVHKFTT